jgi:hypothetical protein
MARRRIKRFRITIQKAETVKGNLGQTKVTGWADITGLVCVPADFEVTGGGEVYRGKQVEAGVDAVFCIRQQPVSIFTTYQVVHQDKAYGIVSVRPVAGHDSADRELLIFVKAVAENG